MKILEKYNDNDHPHLMSDTSTIHSAEGGEAIIWDIIIIIIIIMNITNILIIFTIFERKTGEMEFLL